MFSSAYNHLKLRIKSQERVFYIYRWSSVEQCLYQIEDTKHCLIRGPIVFSVATAGDGEMMGIQFVKPH